MTSDTPMFIFSKVLFWKLRTYSYVQSSVSNIIRHIDNNILTDKLQLKILRTWINIRVNSFIKNSENIVKRDNKLFVISLILKFILYLYTFFNKNHWHFDAGWHDVLIFHEMFFLTAKISPDFSNSLWFFLDMQELGDSLRDIFRTLSNIKDGTICENSQRLLAINYLPKTLHLRCLTGFWMRLSLHVRCNFRFLIMASTKLM